MKKSFSFFCFVFCGCSICRSYDGVEQYLNDPIKFNLYQGVMADSPSNDAAEKELLFRENLLRSEKFWKYAECIFRRQWECKEGFEFRALGFNAQKEQCQSLGFHFPGTMRLCFSENRENDRLIVQGMLFASIYAFALEYGMERAKVMIAEVGENGGIEFEEIYNEI